MELDWDNLLILDAARPEFLPNGEKTTTAVRKSPASYSGGFIEKHFLAGSYYDTVYVTANPHVSQLSEDTFYTVVNLLEESWDKNPETVYPEDVVKAAIKASKEYQNERRGVPDDSGGSRRPSGCQEYGRKPLELLELDRQRGGQP